MNKGRLFVISGPSGCGKDTIISGCLKSLGDKAFLSISMTTRQIRQGEEDGVHYYFVSKEEFERNIEQDKMLEYAKYGSNYYGTPLEPIERLTSEGKIVLLNIEVQGAMNVRRLVPDVCEIFVLPPSVEELERRLRKRGTETEEAIKERMDAAKYELTFADKYDYTIVNDELDDAINQVLEIINNTISEG